MKKIALPLIFLTMIFSCEKVSDLKFTEVIPGDCAKESGVFTKGSKSIGLDGVTYSISNDSLDLLVGFNATCCTDFSTSPQIKGDSIIIKIHSSEPGLCNCICYYTYDFKFIGSGENYKYRVTIDNYRTFKGQINP